MCITVFSSFKNSGIVTLSLKSLLDDLWVSQLLYDAVQTADALWCQTRA